MPDADLLAPLVALAAGALEQRIGGSPLRPWLAQALRDAAGVLPLTLAALVLIPAASWWRRAASPAPAFLAACVASALLGWILLHPAPSVELLMGRIDHLVMVVAAGVALPALSPVWRARLLALVSLAIVCSVAGWEATLVSLAFVVATELLHRRRAILSSGAWLAHGLAAVGALAACFSLRRGDLLVALQAQALFAFVLLRQVSALVDRARGASSSLGEWACYLFFYPSCYGAVELFGDFSKRNAELAAPQDGRAALRAFLSGMWLVWLARRIDVSMDALEAGGWVEVWAATLALFARSALYLTGLWSVIDAIALLLGVRLRPNFARILRSENPSQFWHAWRGTMTRWLTTYVYVPLGGNRRAQVRNIAAAFAVSCLWHWMGVPFVSREVGPVDFAPIGTWALVNGVGVAAFAVTRRRGWRLLPMATPAALRRACHVVGTACFGALTATFLGHYGDRVPRFWGYVGALLGLGD